MATRKERPSVDPKVYKLAETFIKDELEQLGLSCRADKLEDASWDLAALLQTVVEDFTNPDLPHGLAVHLHRRSK